MDAGWLPLLPQLARAQALAAVSPLLDLVAVALDPVDAGWPPLLPQLALAQALALVSPVLGAVPPAGAGAA